MILKDIVETIGLKARTAPEQFEAEISGGYASDMLSDVMANSKKGDVWITLQGHPNIIAVAKLKEITES